MPDGEAIPQIFHVCFPEGLKLGYLVDEMRPKSCSDLPGMFIIWIGHKGYTTDRMIIEPLMKIPVAKYCEQRSSTNDKVYFKLFLVVF